MSTGNGRDGGGGSSGSIGRGGMNSQGRGRMGRGRGRGGRGGRARGGRASSGNFSDRKNDDSGESGSHGSGGNGSNNNAERSTGGRNGYGERRRHFTARGCGSTGRGGRGNGSSNHSSSPDSNTSSTSKDRVEDASNTSEEKAFSTDEEVLIAFGPYVRSGDSEASQIHQEYLVHKNQHEFIDAARQFLIERQSKPPVTEEVKPISKFTHLEEENDPSKDKSSGNGAKSDVFSSGLASAPASLPSPMPLPPGLQAHNQNINSNTVQPCTKPIHVSEGDKVISRAPPGMGNSVLPPKLTSPVSPPISNRPPPGMPPQFRTPPSILPAPVSAPSTDSKPSTESFKPVKIRRTLTRLEEQPGKLFANEIPAAPSGSTMTEDGKPPSLTIRPRSELTARWIIPLSYLRQRAIRKFEEQKVSSQAAPQNLTIRDALKNLAVGLFRRGAPDNGSQASIVSKDILGPESGEPENGRPAKDYPFGIDQRTDSVFGTVPFYAPRTPGNVVFRLYFEDEAHVTLATGPCVSVVPAEGDYDSVLRFILSNFKSKKGTAGISSMHSLASVLELFSPSSKVGSHNRNLFDSAGRVAWGCICESRKVVELAASVYVKKKNQFKEQFEIEESNDKMLKMELSSGEEGIVDETSDANGDENDKKAPNDGRSKLAAEERNNERKWKEVQLAYASILKAAFSNDSNYLLLKRDLISKIRLEYELWCPLCEAFAPNPFADFNDEVAKLPGDVSAFPHPVGNHHMQVCLESRRKMQMQTLGFVPKFDSIASVITKSKKWGKKPIETSIFNDFSNAIDKVFNDEYAVSENVYRRRENVRSNIESMVASSGAFPVGTRVLVFGSSANGFGSPNSDLDLCLQVNGSSSFSNESGVEAMASLATKFTEAGMHDVNTDRLTARIPIVKFNFPYVEYGETIMVECDLSLQNPLACLNTSLLHAYSKNFPSTCVLASVIKRWAKNRDINEPSRHTLSSYGYVLMLLYFLTASESTEDGFVLTPENTKNTAPILPNLQWVDPTWAQNPAGPYREIPAKPKNQYCVVQHPTEPNYLVNSYFYRSGLESLTQFCSHPSRKIPSYGMILASFFHYFAFEFNYKKNVVSLNTKHCYPILEKEIKAEEDGWSLFRQGLAIEDPFESFYDVSHVLKNTNFQTIRKEFALAYTKIMNSLTSKNATGKDLIDMICEPLVRDGEN